MNDELRRGAVAFDLKRGSPGHIRMIIVNEFLAVAEALHFHHLLVHREDLLLLAVLCLPSKNSPLPRRENVGGQVRQLTSLNAISIVFSKRKGRKRRRCALAENYHPSTRAQTPRKQGTVEIDSVSVRRPIRLLVERIRRQVFFAWGRERNDEDDLL